MHIHLMDGQTTDIPNLCRVTEGAQIPAMHVNSMSSRIQCFGDVPRTIANSINRLCTTPNVRRDPSKDRRNGPCHKVKGQQFQCRIAHYVQSDERKEP